MLYWSVTLFTYLTAVWFCPPFTGHDDMITSNDQSTSTDDSVEHLSWTNVKIMLDPFTISQISKMSIWLIHNKVSIHFNSLSVLLLVHQNTVCYCLVCVDFQQFFICEACLCLKNMIVRSGPFVTDAVHWQQSTPRLLSLSFCTQSNFVWVLLSSYSAYNLVINVNNPPWWLCLFHVADR